MKKEIFKHLTVAGFIQGNDLTECELLANKLESAQVKFKEAKNNVKEAKQKLNHALEESIKKIKIEKEKENKTRSNEASDSDFSSVFKIEEIKAKYEKTMADLEIKKNEIKNKLEEYKSDGSEKWESFKHKLNHDLEELGKALKGFVINTK